MVVKWNEEKCISCGACVGICPVKALKQEGKKIIVDETKCISCGACVAICPVGALKL